MRKSNYFDSVSKARLDWLTCRRALTKGSLLLFMACAPGFVHATAVGHNTANVSYESVQQKDVAKGVVKDSKGEPIVGAHIVVKGTTTGTISGVDGDFSLSNIKKGDVIQVSFVGFKTMEVKWNGSPLEIIMMDDSETLNEVVVVGYGSQKKVNVTGSVSMVDSKAIASRPVANVSQALQGVIPGLNLSVGGAGGALDGSMDINIRGAGTIGTGSSASPLILIDGIPGNLNSINPNDIESVSVLKDAASASIYGARASFGVILITTKGGVSGKTKVSYSGNIRFNTAIGVPDVMDSYTFAQYFNRASHNRGGSDIFSEPVLKRIKEYQDGTLKATTIDNGSGIWSKWSSANGNTDWMDEFFGKTATSNEHNISISGGNDKTQFAVSGSFLDQNGILRHGHDEFQRYTLNARITNKVTDWFRLSLNTKWSREDFERPSYLTGAFFHNLARKWPVHPAYDPNGFPMDEGEVQQMESGGVQRNQKDQLTNKLSLIFEPIKDWKINIEGSWKTTTSFQHWDVLPVYAHNVAGNPFPTIWDMGTGKYAPGSSKVSEHAWKGNEYTTNIYSDYSKKFSNGHFFKVMAGFNAELYKTRNITAEGNSLISPSVATVGQTMENPFVDGGYDHYSVAGFFARANYNYKDRYMVELNGRYDGSSRFIGKERWGLFPSLSLGWNIARENFFANVGRKLKIETLKLRGSWGQLGNNNTKSWYPFYQNMPTGKNYNWLVQGNRPNYSSNPGMVSSLLTWETVESWDLGIDFGLLNNRLTGSFDYFVRNTKDMVGPAPELPSVLGTGVPRVNNCDMKSYGWELEIGWRDRINDFSYGVKAVLYDDQQKVTRYPNATKSLSTYYDGAKLGEIWGYTTIGIANSQDEMDAHLATTKQSSLGNGWGAGDIMYKDLDGDGEINNGDNKIGSTGDLRIIGNSTPRYKFGITFDAAYKGIDFRMFLQGVGKRDLWLGSNYFWGATGMGNQWQAAGFVEHLDYWRPKDDPLGENLNAYYPKVNFGGGRNTAVQTRYLQNGAYLRLKNIQLGYTLPKSWTEKAGMSMLRFYVSADNLLTFTSLSDIYDPETTSNNGKIYPLQRVVSLGVNINF